MDLNLQYLLETAIKASRKAGKIQIEHLTRPKKVFFKGTIDLVTDVDKKSEEVILTLLEKSFPSADILSEESPYSPSDSPYLWIVDPLDGTTNYAHGYPCFSVSIAFQAEGDMILGVVYNPVTDECYTAIRGHGSLKNGKPLKVSSTKTVETSLLCTGFPYDVGSAKRNNLREFTTIIQHAQGVRRDGSAALDLCRVAEGAFDGFWELKLKPWDVAAGALIVSEAGGTVTTFEGNTFDPFADTIISTNGLIHEELRTLLTKKA